MDDKQRGWYPKYHIMKNVEVPAEECTDDCVFCKKDCRALTVVKQVPVDPEAEYLVLRLDTSIAARSAAWAYCRFIEGEYPQLAEDIRAKVVKYSKGVLWD